MENTDHLLEAKVKNKYGNVHKNLTNLTQKENTKHKNQDNKTFYMRVDNKSNVKFTSTEMALLNKGLQ
jgi:hypothetical protein